MGSTTRRCFLGAILLLVCPACAPGCSGTVRNGDLPPVVIVSVDTLRADRLPLYGATGVETPTLQRLARDAVLFENAFTHAPTTLPAHASLLTGLLPGQHGARDNAHYAVHPGTATAAAVLARAGYRTGAFVSAFPLRVESGLDAGFDRYDARLEALGAGGLSEIQRDGEATLREALAWLRTPDERPPFLFLHLFEPHLPYTPPADLEARYGATYEAEIADADRLLGRLVDALKQAGLYEDALLVFLSDHGEGLGDHGEDDHGLFVYASTLRVPLLVKLPGNRRGGERVEAPAQLVDVLPTILEVTDADGPDDLPGISLLRLEPGTGTRSIYSESYVSRLHFGWSELLSVIEFPLHYIEAPDPELFDLTADPAELRNLSFERPAAARRLAETVADLEVPLGDPLDLDREARDRLMVLGYVGAGGGHAETLADPKTKLHLIRHLKTASALFFEGRLEEAAAEYRSTLREDPGIAAAWEFLGRAQVALGHLDDAIVSFETLVAMGGDDAMVNRSLAQLYLQTGRADLAQLAARRAVADDPDDAGAHLVLADALLAGGTGLEEALAAAERARQLAADGGPPGGRIVRGRILLALGREQAAAAAFRDEIEQYPGNLQAYRQLAHLRFRTGDGDAGRRVLEEMVRRNPGPQAESWAVQILREAGLDAAAEAWRKRAAERYPDDPAFESA